MLKIIVSPAASQIRVVTFNAQRLRLQAASLLLCNRGQLARSVNLLTQILSLKRNFFGISSELKAGIVEVGLAARVDETTLTLIFENLGFLHFHVAS